MNRTLLLILCDFLLLNLLALTRWETVDSPAPARAPVAMSGAPGERNEELLAVMKLAAEEEREARQVVEKRLSQTSSDLESKADDLARLQKEQAALDAALAAARREFAALQERHRDATRRADLSREELEKREAELARQARTMDTLETARKQAQSKAENLDVQLRVAEVEKEILRKKMAEDFQKTLAQREAQLQAQARKREQELAALAHQREMELARQKKEIDALVQTRETERKQVQDLKDTVRLAELERKLLRETLSEQYQRDLKQKEMALAKQEEALVELTRQRTTAQSQADELARAVSVAEKEKEIIRNTLASQLEKERQEQREKAARDARALADLRAKQAEALKKVSDLNLAMREVEVERTFLRENLSEVKEEVASVRAEKAQAEQRADALAAGVTELAESSRAIQRDIQDYKPINPNSVFNSLLNNLVRVSLAATRPGFLFSQDRSEVASTIVLRNGDRHYAVLHISDTPLRFSDPGLKWETLKGQISRGGKGAFEFRQFGFLQVDPRVVVVPLAAEEVARLGVDPYEVTPEPFKYSAAVLINKSGRYYGETAFKVDPRNASYVRLDNRFFKRLFGEFSPNRGDLLLSPDGRVIGMMVNREYCALLGDFTTARMLPTGADLGPRRIDLQLEEMHQRLQAKPEDLH